MSVQTWVWPISGSGRVAFHFMGTASARLGADVKFRLRRWGFGLGKECPLMGAGWENKLRLPKQPFPLPD